MNLSLSEQLAYSTVRIECEYGDNSTGTGTGFFFKFLEKKENDLHVPVVITNKHVIRNATKGSLIMTTTNKNNEPNDKDHFQGFFNDFENIWRLHPDNDVDLCAMPLHLF